MNFTEAVKAYIKAYDDFGDSCSCHPIVIIRRKAWDDAMIGIMSSWGGIGTWIQYKSRERPLLHEDRGISFDDALAEDWELIHFPLGKPNHK